MKGRGCTYPVYPVYAAEVDGWSLTSLSEDLLSMSKSSAPELMPLLSPSVSTSSYTSICLFCHCSLTILLTCTFTPRIFLVATAAHEQLLRSRPHTRTRTPELTFMCDDVRESPKIRVYYRAKGKPMATRQKAYEGLHVTWV